MKLIYLLMSFLVVCGTVHADDSLKDSIELPVDTTEWVPVSVQFPTERVEMLFPQQPEEEREEGKLLQWIHYHCKDNDNMTYSLTLLSFPDKENFPQYIKELMESIEKTPNARVIYDGYKCFKTDDRVFVVGWVESDKMTRLKVIRGKQHLYLLETSNHHHSYRNLDTEATDNLLQQFIYDFAKTQLFTESFQMN